MVDRIITLFESTDTDFSTNGLGTLPDAIKCEVVEEANGPYELEMEYPITGGLYDEIMFRRILYTKPNPYANKQPFRIYAISKPISGRVTVNAQHISYDLANYTVSPFSAPTIGEAFANMKLAMDDLDNCPFEFWTDKETSADMATEVPINARTILGGIEGSILDTYRGEYEWDCYTVKLWNNRGEDRGVSIRYGKNLTDLRQEENCSEVYTAVRPYWYRAPNNVEPQEDLNPDSEADPEEPIPQDNNTGFVQLESTVSSNLIIDEIKYGNDEENKDTNINDNGVIVSGSTDYRMVYARVESGINYTVVCDSTTELVCGFFTEIPDVGSTSYNNQKQTVNPMSFTAPIDGYIAFRLPIDYEYPVMDRLPFHILFVDAYSDFTRIMALDLTNEIDHKPTEEELAIAAVEYVNSHDIGSPKVSLEVSFINLSDSSEYKDLALLEMVKLCDTVDVAFPKLGVSSTAKVVKTNYNVLSGRYNSIELGSLKADLSTTISESKKETSEKVTQSDLSAAVIEATRQITGQTGGFVVLNPPDHPQEILIMDKPTIDTAVNVWRWNRKGLGFSSTGYYGTYGTAITADGKIVADFIKAGTMSADQIFGGTLQLGKNSNVAGRSAGSLIVYDENDAKIGELNKNGLTMYGKEGFYLLINPSIGFGGLQMAPGSTTPNPITDTRLFWVNKDEFHMKRAVVEEDIAFCGKMRFIPITIYDENDPTIITNEGIALVSI